MAGGSPSPDPIAGSGVGLARQTLPKAETVAFELDHVTMVGETVEQGAAQLAAVSSKAKKGKCGRHVFCSNEIMNIIVNERFFYYNLNQIMFQKFSERAVQFLLRYAAEPEDSEEWQLKKTIGVASIAIGSLSWFAYSLMWFLLHEPFAASVCISGGILFVLGLLSYGVFRHYAIHWYYWFAINTLGATLVHFILGGFAQSGMVMLWVLVIPLEALVAYKPRHGLMMFLSTVAIIVIAAFLQPYNPRLTNILPPNLITRLFVMNTVGVATYMIAAVYYFVWRNEILKNLVLIEQKKGEALLLNILPKEIAPILKEGRTIANYFDSVSVLFADIAGSTPLYEVMDVKEMVNWLNEIFSQFDTMIEKYGLEKIRNNGDNYMVASGVPIQRPDHAKAVALLALEMNHFLSEIPERNGNQLQFRIGIHSGPVVAGVIGKTKFTYDAWGDTVNVASRMESHGVAGMIQITETTYELLKEEFICEPRGLIDIKGKGSMNTWFLMGKK
jgi:adenylate cyclase